MAQGTSQQGLSHSKPGFTTVNQNVDYSTLDLEGRVAELGNHHQKHIHKIQQYYDVLVSLIDQEALVDQFRLLRFSPTPFREMGLITQLLDDRKTVLDMLGCYYSLQFLLMNFKALDVLQLNLATSVNRYNTYKHFLKRTGTDFRSLSGAYMKTLLNLFFRNRTRPDFVVCSVGTRVDQDDIDIGVIDTGETQRDTINAAFGFLNTEMLKHSSALHFHLSEHVGKRGYSASIAEYHELLDDEIQDVVILSEMLNAVPILGNSALFTQFKTEILKRYYYREDQDNQYHEGCLRGLLGEIRDLIMREPPENILNPKNDALRMIKAVIFALKTAKQVERYTALDVLDTLILSDSANYENYTRIHNAFTFFETFRFFYQLYVIQEEEISIEDPNITDNLQGVARAMGYEDKNYAPAYTQLIIHYQDHLKTARLGAENLVQHITQHLSRITIFYPMTHIQVDSEGNEKYAGNTVLDFMHKSRFFSGTRFWDDILKVFRQEDQVLINRFIRDFQEIPSERQPKIMQMYVNWGGLSPYTMISLITIMAESKPNLRDSQLIQTFAKIFISNIDKSLQSISRLSRVLILFPQTMNNFLAILPDEQLYQLIQILDQPVWHQETDRMRERLMTLCQLFRYSSHFFRRFIRKVSNKYAYYSISLNNPPKYRQLAEGLLRNIDNFDTIEEKIDKLGDYYDFEFLRLGIHAVKGMDFHTINKEFTIFSDNYIRILFELCREEVTKSVSNAPETKDLLAIFAAGGHARSQAFDDDYDLIILLNSDDQEILAFANQIALRMNKHIIRRAIMPHYRFADRFRNYVTTFGELRSFFRNPDEYVFIDQSQLLGARMVVGSAHFEKSYEEQLIEPYIYHQKEKFIAFLLHEIQSHQSYHEEASEIDVKECPGGLRDMENFLFILKAHLIIRQPIAPRLFSQICRQLPDLREKLYQIKDDYYFLKHVRDLYHLIVSDDDILQPGYLGYILQPLNNARDSHIPDAAALEKQIQQSMRNNIQNSRAVLQSLGYEMR